MDNLTHSLTGLALARAGLNRFPHATLLAIIAANIPDVDMASWIQGRFQALEIHRGYAHSLICLPLMALLAVGITAAISRRRLPWLLAWMIACIGVASHLLLDWCTSYGTRLLLPFSSRWFYLDIFSLVDWIVLAVLILAWAGPFLSGLVSSEIGGRRSSGKGLAIFALLLFVFYAGFRGLMHSRVMSQLESRIYDDVLGGAAVRMAALPRALSPFAWNAIVEGEHAYRLYQLSAFGMFDPGEGNVLYKGNWNPDFATASRTPAFRYCLYFSRFPYWQEAPGSGPEEINVVTLTDLRFGAPGESFIAVHARIDHRGEVESTSFAGQQVKR
jgi:inner membrane protein